MKATLAAALCLFALAMACSHPAKPVDPSAYALEGHRPTTLEGYRAAYDDLDEITITDARDAGLNERQ